MTPATTRPSFWITLLLSKLLIVAVILFAGIGLSGDEAQYWTWSTKLDYGYYSKPPGIAWQIHLGTLFFGNSELGVRFLSLIVSAATAFAIAFVAFEVTENRRGALLAAIAFLLSPIGCIGSLFATTDGVMLLCWILCLGIFIRSRKREDKKCGQTPYAVLGLIIGIGALWKWVAFLFWIFVLCFDVLHKRFKVFPFISGLVISLLGLLPSLYWNIFHDFATFKHVAATLDDQRFSLTHGGNFFDFLGAQFILLSPLFAFMIIWEAVQNRKNKNVQVLLWVSCLYLGLLCIVSFFKKVQGNWAVVALAGLIPLLGFSGSTRASLRFFWSSAFVSILLQLFLFLLPTWQAAERPFITPPPFKMNPFKQLLGEDLISEELLLAGYNPNRDFLFSDRYQWTAQISFYGPKQKLAYFFNMHGLRRNQFTYWPQMDQMEKGKRGFFVTFLTEKDIISQSLIEDKIVAKLAKAFDQVSLKGSYPIFIQGGISRRLMLIYECRGYNGFMPGLSSTY